MKYMKMNDCQFVLAKEANISSYNRETSLICDIKCNSPAFTLAEVLITLGIIGIVAAITISTLINNVQNRELYTSLQKAYSTLSQALLMYQNDNGYPITSELTRGQLKPVLMKYIKSARDCGIGSTDPDKACIPNKYFVSDKDNYKTVYKNFNGTNEINYTAFDDGQFVINDGMFVMIENAYQPNSTLTPRRVWISVDVNGFNKRPNRLGQDLFMFQIDKNGKFMPMGGQDTEYYGKDNTYCSLTSTININGISCTYKALSDKDFFKNLPK